MWSHKADWNLAAPLRSSDPGKPYLGKGRTMLGQDTNELTPFVVLTGAGISAQSGIPTFRGHGGLWQEHHAQDLATPEAYRRDPDLVWRFYAWRRELVREANPNAAHLTLADMELKLGDFQLITQNIDGLHQRAGNRNVIELHGSLWRLRCTRCEDRWEDTHVPLPQPIPQCPGCGAAARPDVVWFGETLDPAVLEEAYHMASRARYMLVIGTSGVVYPAAQLPIIAKEAGAQLVEINLEPTPITPLVDQFLQDDASTSLAQWWEEIFP